jgi:hypothetical protein
MPHIPIHPLAERAGRNHRRIARQTASSALHRPPLCVFMLCMAAIFWLPAQCLAQDMAPPWWTLNAGGGLAPAAGTAKNTLNRGWNFHAGGGFVLKPLPPPDNKALLLLTFNFMYDQLDVKPTALQQARIMNPTNFGLLEASSGKAKFYSLTMDPTVRIPVSRAVGVYVFGGFGWFRRNLEFNGTSAQGALLQPGSPAVFGTGGNSGVCDAGGGVNFKLSRQRGHWVAYAEARFLHGLAINKYTTLLPISAGIRW